MAEERKCRHCHQPIRDVNNEKVVMGVDSMGFPRVEYYLHKSCEANYKLGLEQFGRDQYS